MGEEIERHWSEDLTDEQGRELARRPKPPFDPRTYLDDARRNLDYAIADLRSYVRTSKDATR